MKRPIWATVVTVVMTATIGAVPAHAAAALGTPAAAVAAGDPVDPPLYDETAGGGTVRVNVVTKSRTDLPGAAAVGTMMQSFESLPVVTLKVDQDGLEELAAQPGVVSVTEDVPARPTLDGSAQLVGADVAAAAGETGQGSAIAILDTGVDTSHPFLKDRIVAEACFSPIVPDSSATSLCPNGAEEQEGPGSADSGTGPCATVIGCDHGTHVAGIAAGNGKNLTGAPAAGVAPAADIIAIQIFSQFNSEDFCGSPDDTPCVASFASAQLAGLEKVLQLKRSGTPVIAANLSLGSGRYGTACDDDARKQVIDDLFSAGVATVVAAGNNGYENAVTGPACVSSAIAVGSTTADDELSAFTNRGPLLDLFAPGTSIVSSVPGGGYAAKSGTSMAAPHVAGALAVLRQAFPEKSLASLESLLKTTGKPITYTGATTPRTDLAKALGEGVGNIADFNCDRIEDIAIADPEATVGGDAKAGVVRIVYGGGKGTAEINQDLPTVPGGAEPNDFFGDALATVDHDRDGCTDLVAAASREDVGSLADVGVVDIIYGSAAGLAAGKTSLHLEQRTGSGAILAAASEAGDRMGAALAAGLTLAKEPYLVIGSPGEDIDDKTDAGGAFYLRGTVNKALVQGKSVADTAEAGDRFGSSVAATPEHVVIGIPGEGVVPYRSGPNTAEVVSGAVEVLSHTLNSSGVPTHLGSARQTDPLVNSGVAEAGDQFGAAVSAAEGTVTMGDLTLRGSYVAIGVPGEDIAYEGADKADAGRVVVLTVINNRSPVVAELNDYQQGPEDVIGAPEAGDRMGAQVTLANLGSGKTTASDLRMAVGVPGEDIGTVVDAGAVSVFSLVGAPGANDRWIQAGNTPGMPGTPGTSQKTGSSLYGTATRLYIGMPYGPGTYGALYAMPWANAGGGTVQPVITYAPGTGGLPANGLRFGMAAR